MKITERRDFLKTSALAASTLFIPREVFAAEEPAMDKAGADVAMRALVMSDVHFNGDPKSKETERFCRATRFVYDYSKNQPYKNLDALVVVGDMSNHGNEAELTLFKKTMDAEVKEGTKTVLCMGNHEFYGGNQAYWKSVFGVEPNATYDVNGFKFVMISPEKGTMADGDYLYAVKFLEEELKKAEAEDPAKPIFVCQHYPVSPTVYGGRGYDDWGAEDLFDLLQAHPRVVNFSGHTHYPINDPRCAWQGCFSAFGTGTLSYVCHGHEGRGFQKYLAEDGGYAQFYILEVRRDNSVTLKPYDMTTNSFFDLVFFVAKPGAISEYVYTDARYSTSEKPKWREGTTPKVEVLDPYSAKIEFPQATGRDGVLGYQLLLERLDAKTNKWEPDQTVSFWSWYFLRDMPEIAKGEMNELEPGSSYRGKAIALNAFMRESETALEFAFQTPSDPDAVDKDSPKPNPDLYDLRVENGELVNKPVNKREKQFALEKRGEPKIVEEPLLGGMKVVEFSGKDFYKSPNTAEDQRKIRRAGISALFMLDKDATGSNSVFSNTQMGGLALSYDDEKKQIRLWVSVNGNYVVIGAPIEKGRYYDAFGTYDGKRAVLYLDGKEVAAQEARGAIKHTQVEAARAFVLGGDIAENGGGEALFKGRIARARLYSWAPTAEQVANLHSDSEKK
ncbi:MAG: metallophosphoesterase [Thermoguttaceae bacterium]|nr:metallophosphoesterase [Thermoguttaceae bacterium]